MKAEDIKVGMWVRDPGGDVCKTSRQSEIVRGWHVKYPGGRLHTWPSEQLEPWTPRVGEWVRDSMTGVTREVATMWESHGTWWSAGDGVYGRVSDSEPCLPPAPPTTHLRAAGVEVPAKVEFKPVAGPTVVYTNTKPGTDVLAPIRQMLDNIGANATCPNCGGMAYLGLQEARCLAPKCERVEPEPEVVEGWVLHKHYASGERQFIAHGLGQNVAHPIREEAIRLWREAVARG